MKHQPGDHPEDILFFFDGHPHLLTLIERRALRRLRGQQKVQSSSEPMRRMLEERFLTSEPEVLSLLEQGEEAFFRTSLERVRRESGHELNCCPRCGSLCRTSEACVCPQCNHSWYERRHRDPNVILRPAAAADADSVAEVYLASRREFLPFAPMAHPEENVRRWISDRLIPSGEVTVAHREGRVIGMMHLAREDDLSWIEQLYLSPDVVGQGVGSTMVVFAREALPTPIRLYTFQENTSARRFYERHGFRAIAFSDGASNEEGCPDVLYEYSGED